MIIYIEFKSSLSIPPAGSYCPGAHHLLHHTHGRVAGLQRVSGHLGQPLSESICQGHAGTHRSDLQGTEYCWGRE